MASQISGLDPLQGYLKHGNYVVEMHVPYLQLEAKHEKFIERKIEPPSGPESNGKHVPPSPEPPSVPSLELKPKPPEQQQHFFE